MSRCALSFIQIVNIFARLFEILDLLDLKKINFICLRVTVLPISFLAIVHLSYSPGQTY